MRALSAGHLRAIRDNEGRWQIEPEALEDWLSMRRTPDRQYPTVSSGHPSPAPLDTPETLSKLAASEARSEALAAQVDDLKAERDRLLSIIERQSEPRPGILMRLFRR